MIGEAGFDDDNQSLAFSVHPQSQVLDDDNSEDTLQGNTVARLWKYCEESRAGVKLLLPDALHIPFYLPMQRKKQMNVEQQMEREQRRLETISLHAISQITQRTAHIHMPDFSGKLLNRREKLIENKIMDKYRKNSDKAEEIIKKYLKAKIKKYKEKKEKVIPPRRFSLHEGPMVSLAPDRHARASIRRSTILDIQQEQLKMKEEKWIERIQKVEEESQKAVNNTSGQRQIEWMICITALIKLKQIHTIVHNVREIKRKDAIRWNAALKIQRIYRKRLDRIQQNKTSQSNTYTPHALRRMRSKLHKSSAHDLYESRVNACEIITNILRLAQKTWKSIFLGYVRKVRLIQRRVRLHLYYNSYRVEAMSMLLERIYPAFFAHIQMVQSGKGLDLQNLQPIDLNRLKEGTRSLNKFQVVGTLETPSAHSLIRSTLNALKVSSRYFGPAKSHLYLSMIKRRAILDIVFQKRRQFHRKMITTQNMTLQLKKFSMDDIKSFVQGGEDPLSRHLVEVEVAQQQIHQQYMQTFQQKKVKTRMSKQFMPSKPLKPVFLLFFTTLNAEDVINLYSKISERAMNMTGRPRNNYRTAVMSTKSDDNKDSLSPSLSASLDPTGKSRSRGEGMDIEIERLEREGLARAGQKAEAVVGERKKAEQDKSLSKPTPPAGGSFAKRAHSQRKHSTFRPPDELLSLNVEVGEYIKRIGSSIDGSSPRSPRFSPRTEKEGEGREAEGTGVGVGRRRSTAYRRGSANIPGDPPIPITQALNRLVRIKKDRDGEEDEESGLKQSLTKGLGGGKKAKGKGLAPTPPAVEKPSYLGR